MDFPDTTKMMQHILSKLGPKPFPFECGHFLPNIHTWVMFHTNISLKPTPKKQDPILLDEISSDLTTSD